LSRKIKKYNHNILWLSDWINCNVLIYKKFEKFIAIIVPIIFITSSIFNFFIHKWMSKIKQIKGMTSILLLHFATMNIFSYTFNKRLMFCLNLNVLSKLTLKFLTTLIFVKYKYFCILEWVIKTLFGYLT